MTDFSATIDGDVIRCAVVVDEPMHDVVFCCSLMAPPTIVDGGKLLSHTGGFGEFALPDLVPGQPHEFVLRYALPDYRPVNRAWLPLGPYVRHTGGALPLTPGRSGADKWQPPSNAERPDLALCPRPASWAPANGFVSITGFNYASQLLDNVNELAIRQGLEPFFNPTGLPLTVDHLADIPAEGYELDISSDKVVLRAGDDAGVLYGGISLLTLSHTHPEGLPLGTITDAPGFAWRGHHLDCARHFFSVETILDMLDLMALQKLNRFHWHFADDEAFRLELPSLPELRATGFRGEGQLVPGVFGGGIRAGGLYSRADAERTIAHARALNIEVMPEAEFPAHALCLNRAIDGMRDPDDTGTEQSVQGYAENTLNPAMDKTWQVIEAIIADVADIFPFDYIHVGCDELPENTWAGSPAAAKMRQELQLETTDDLQAHMMRRVAEIVISNGKMPAAWEEAARGNGGGIGNGALLFSWTGQGPGIEAAKVGYDVVMCPAQNVYLDMAQTDDPDDWGAAWAAFVDLPDTIDWTPVPNVNGLDTARIKGVQGAFWAEFTTADWELSNMIFPRILGVATMAWGAGARTSAKDLQSLAGAYVTTPFANILPVPDDRNAHQG